MAEIITLFQETSSSLNSYWRTVILFGCKVASYKFAFAKNPLEIALTSCDTVTLNVLAEPFLKHPPKKISIPAHFSPAIDRYGLIARLLRACHPIP